MIEQLNKIQMKTLHNNIGFLLALLSIFTFSCADEIDPVIAELDTDRAFAPVNLEAVVRNQTTIEVDWTIKASVSEYVVEFYEDSLNFNTVVRTLTVSPDSLPVREQFFGDTRYSIRVKSVSSNPNLGESTWAETTIRTEAENIFLPFQDYDVLWDEITVRFPENSEVTRLVINPGNIEKTISAAEAAAGVATIPDLSGSTEYTITLFSNNSPRGQLMVSSLIDPTSPNVTLVNPGDDIAGAIASTIAGNIVLLNPGDYFSSAGSITIDKNISIRGQYPYNRPVIYNAFDLVDGANDTQLIDLEMNGDAGATTTVITLDEAGVVFGSVLISGCYIHDYGRQLISGSNASELNSFTVDNSIVSNFISGGGDFIDFRGGHVNSILLTNSTFNNTPAARDFIRLDDSSGNFPGSTSEVVIENCTLYAIANSEDRVFYVRFVENDLTIRNTLIAETDAFYTRETNASPINMSNNNYYNAEGFYTAGYRSESAFQYDQGNFTTLDPGFVDAENGDFTITNQTLLDNQIGDPRWR